MLSSAALGLTVRRLGEGTVLAGVTLVLPVAAHAGAGATAIAGAPNLPVPNLGSTTLPAVGSVVSVSATIDTGARSVTVNQSTAKAIINWSAFNVAAGNTVVFNQPTAGSATLNRVTGTTASTIAGQISSNGAVYLVNPNGIAITATGNVQTGGGFIASTLDIANADFNAGKLKFAGVASAKGASKAVTNAGTITSSAGGYVALLGGSVSNSGTISVPAGKVALGSGESIALDLNGGGFLQVAVPSNLADAAVSNSGKITAAGGRIELKAASAASAVRNVINMSGTISADSAVSDGGSIILLGGDGGTTSVTGTLTARATGPIGNGGFIETSGAKVDFTGAKITTKSAAGKAGQWLVDPTDLVVDAAAAATISTTLNGGSDVTLQTTATTATGAGNQSAGNGDITIASGITWTSANTLSLLAYNNIAINGAITGTAGGLTLTAGNGVSTAGAISDTAALSVGTFKLTNGTWTQTGTLPAFSATDFRIDTNNSAFLRATGGAGTTGDPYRIADVYGLQGAASFALLANSFKLSNAIDASGTAAWNGGTGFSPIGSDQVYSVQFTGNFDGQGFAVDKLTIKRPNDGNVGLLGLVAGGTISNLGVTNANITGKTNVGVIGSQTGGTISNVTSSGTVTGTKGSGSNIGGLVGNQAAGTIASSASSAAVSGFLAVGGLVGQSAGAITGSNATGAVSGTSGGSQFGGLVGFMSAGTISDSYATGAVTNLNGAAIGGLVGKASGAITNVNAPGTYVYATGAVNGLSQVGGLVGSTTTGFSVTGAYATGNVTAVGGNAGGLIGITAGTTTLDTVYATGTVSAGGNAVGGLVGNLTITGGGITNAYATGNVSSSGINVGGLVGTFSASTASPSITKSYATGSVNTTNAATTTSAGGLVGSANQGAISDSYATGNVTAGGGNVGGLVGTLTLTTISRDYASGGVIGDAAVGGLIGYVAGSTGFTIGDAYATGAVRAKGTSGSAGGLIGDVVASAATITKVYATGAATVVNGSVGGLVATLASGSTITNAYASGKVTGSSFAGGFVGINAGTINGSYWDQSSTGKMFGVGTTIGTGSAFALNSVTTGANTRAYTKTSYRLVNGSASVGTATPSGFVFLAGDSTRPFLAFEVPTAAITPKDAAGNLIISNSHQLQLIGFNATTSAAKYVLGGNIDLAETGAVVAGTPGSYAGMWSSAGFVPLGGDGTGNTLNGTSGGYNLLSTFAAGDIRGFSGTLDGGGFTLSNLTINRTATTQQNAGLFGVLSGTATNVKVTGNVSGYNGVGGIAGLLWTGGSVAGSTSSVNVTGNNLVGGLVGNATDGSTVTKSTASGTATSITGGDVGGLIGYASGATVSGSSASGAASGKYFIGGLIGYAYNTTISGSSATGAATASIDTAGSQVGFLNGGSLTGGTGTGIVTAPRNQGGRVGQTSNGATIN